MAELIAETVNSILKHGLSWAAAGSIVAAFIKYRKDVLRLIHRGKQQETQIDRIERNQRLIMQHLGVEEWGAGEIASMQNTANKQGKFLLQFGWVTRAFAIGARPRITERHTESRKIATKLYSGRLPKMREYLKKLGRTKFQAFLIATFTNIGLLLGYVLDVQDVQSKVTEWTPLILAVSQLAAGAIYQYVEGGVDKEKAKAEAIPPENATTAVSDVEKSYHGE